jgi:tetratricopeptide (TPR) repeat protein
MPTEAEVMRHTVPSSRMSCVVSSGKTRASRIAFFLMIALLLHRGIVAQVATAAKLKADAIQSQADGDEDLAAKLYVQALAQDPAWTEGWWKYGGMLYEAQKFQQASEAFGHLIQLAPQNSLGFAMLGMSEYGLGDWSNASFHLNKSLVHGGLPQAIANGAMYEYALVLMRQKNRNGALIALRLLQRAAPDYPNLVSAFGSAELGLEQIPAPDTEDAQAVSLVGQAAIDVLLLKPHDAERFYRQAIHEHPQLPFAHLCLALFLDNLGRDAEAEAEFKAEAALNPSSPDAWIWLARLALARRETEPTRTYAAEAVKRAPNDGLPYLLAGRSYVIDQQWNKALDALKKAEALSPDSYEVHYALVSVYGALHDEKAADSERKLFTQAYVVAHPQQKDDQ